jgi:hypothetical protein
VNNSGSARKNNFSSKEQKKSDLRFPFLRLKTENLGLKSPFFRQKRRSWIQERRFSAKNGKVGPGIVIFAPKTPMLDLKTPFLVQKRRF